MSTTKSRLTMPGEFPKTTKAHIAAVFRVMPSPPPGATSTEILLDSDFCLPTPEEKAKIKALEAELATLPEYQEAPPAKAPGAKTTT